MIFFSPAVSFWQHMDHNASTTIQIHLTRNLIGRLNQNVRLSSAFVIFFNAQKKPACHITID